MVCWNLLHAHSQGLLPHNILHAFDYRQHTMQKFAMKVLQLSHSIDKIIAKMFFITGRYLSSIRWARKGTGDYIYKRQLH
jgi:hypothetical protein